MHRRHFIKTSGLSLAGLLITDFVKAGDKKKYIIQMPDVVEILTTDHYISLHTADQQTWNYKDISIELKKLNDVINVYVQSPTIALKEVKLSWKYNFKNSASILGDHWERTYGDVSWQKINSSKKLPWYCIARDGNNTT